MPESQQVTKDEKHFNPSTPANKRIMHAGEHIKKMQSALATAIQHANSALVFLRDEEEASMEATRDALVGLTGKTGMTFDNHVKMFNMHGGTLQE